jgi:hypothetical protein
MKETESPNNIDREEDSWEFLASNPPYFEHSMKTRQSTFYKEKGFPEPYLWNLEKPIQIKMKKYLKSNPILRLSKNVSRRT